MRAIFDTEQPSVNYVIDGEKIYVFICVNGEWAERESDSESELEKSWECDYREIITNKNNIDIDKVKATPEKYLDWVEPQEKTDREKISELQEQNKMLTQCLMEMSEIVYA